MKTNSVKAVTLPMLTIPRVIIALDIPCDNHRDYTKLPSVREYNEKLHFDLDGIRMKL